MMLQCADCEFGKARPNGNIDMTCNAARNIKEEACLMKWILVKLANIEQRQAHVIDVGNNFLPMQAKVLQHSCAQIDELQKGESWKHGSDEDEPAG